ncbi:MAG: protein-methionine-sulfoxide reductase catalytic subunit MsrP [Thiotrichales bacterium]
MLIRIKPRHAVLPSEITPESIYRERRRFMQGAIAAGTAAILGEVALNPALAVLPKGFENLPKSRFSTGEKLTSFKDVTTYNNFYELGTAKEDPARNAKQLVTVPWQVRVTGHCDQPGEYTLEDILKGRSLEERIYRLRCVEGWSMVIPWIGFPLADLLKRFGPRAQAKYVAFETLHDPVNLRGQRRPVLAWPYVEGLRIDEAMHPLTLIAVGLYDQALLNQNGAPLRLVVPWKYGFKSLKSIVKIDFVEQMPPTSWNIAAPKEYGFYANVNPAVDHPRWSQKRERRIGEFLKRPTLPFNGYADEVASLYAGSDLRRDF